MKCAWDSLRDIPSSPARDEIIVSMLEKCFFSSSVYLMGRPILLKIMPQYLVEMRFGDPLHNPPDPVKIVRRLAIENGIKEWKPEDETAVFFESGYFVLLYLETGSLSHMCDDQDDFFREFTGMCETLKESNAVAYRKLGLERVDAAEMTLLHHYSNFVRTMLTALPSRGNKRRILDIATRLTGGKYSPGSCQMSDVNRRVLIYEQLGVIKKQPRALRRSEVRNALWTINIHEAQVYVLSALVPYCPVVYSICGTTKDNPSYEIHITEYEMNFDFIRLVSIHRTGVPSYNDGLSSNAAGVVSAVEKNKPAYNIRRDLLTYEYVRVLMLITEDSLDGSHFKQNVLSNVATCVPTSAPFKGSSVVTERGAKTTTYKANWFDVSEEEQEQVYDSEEGDSTSLVASQALLMCKYDTSVEGKKSSKKSNSSPKVQAAATAEKEKVPKAQAAAPTVDATDRKDTPVHAQLAQEHGKNDEIINCFLRKYPAMLMENLSMTELIESSSALMHLFSPNMYAGSVYDDDEFLGLINVRDPDAEGAS